MEAKGERAGADSMIFKIPDLKIKKRAPKRQERAKAESTAVEASSLDFSKSFFPRRTEMRLPAPAPKRSPKA